jgi:Kef-type K+ transport system membrane component KefB
MIGNPDATYGEPGVLPAAVDGRADHASPPWTPLDPFGHSAMRRLERHLVHGYRDETLSAMGDLSPGNHAAVLQPAEVPAVIAPAVAEPWPEPAAPKASLRRPQLAAERGDALPAAPIPGQELLVFLAQVSLLLVLAVAFGRLAARFGLPGVLGELAVGVFLGPSCLAHVLPAVSRWIFPAHGEQFHLLDAVAQIGVVLLVGVTGIHLDVGLVRRRWRAAAGVSTGGLVIPLGLGIVTGLFFAHSLIPAHTDRVVFALFLGVTMCVSAIPVIAKILIDMRLLHRDIGQLALTAGMVDDAFGWLMLSVVSALATTGLTAQNVIRSVAGLIGVVLVAGLIGRPVARLGFRAAARSANDELTVATAVATIVIFAAVTQALGLEAVFGAFVGGIVVGTALGSGRSRLAALRTIVVSVLAPIFFATAGLRMDLTSLWHPAVLTGGLLVLGVAILGKFAGAYLGSRASRLGHWEGLALGAALNARGVIEVVVAMVGLRLGVLSVPAYTTIVLVAIVTSAMAPPILRLTMARVEQTAEEELRGRTLLVPADPGQPVQSGQV